MPAPHRPPVVIACPALCLRASSFWGRRTTGLTVLSLLALGLLTACGGATHEPTAAPHQPAPAINVDTLSATLQQRIARHPAATVAVAVRDAATGTRLALLGDRLFHAASTMKVPVMIEVFRQAEAGRFALDDSIAVVNAFRSIVDGSPYSMALSEDADESLYGQVGRSLSIRDLVYQMITVSSNLATNILIDRVTPAAVQATTERLGTTAMQTLRGVEDIKAYRQGLSNRTTATDLATLLEALGQGRAVSPAADSAMVAILLDQQFNEMIPAGLPPDVRVAHKTGWITGIHHDAALVYPPHGPPYVLVILTEGLADAATAAALAADLAAAVHTTLRPGP